ncbi:hypothetical protein [Alicycliphilus denitrificans]|uniref:Uncharacterized protein n=1 Tax=Alicycliphilus denitrificans TaxID=179636 RepID=A0A420K7W8_9BURK|nr:hypothetical protein [Alicycliphilus denitrificans]RKJ94538.1 hypothetical protein CE154_019685 [Alicycliphilus denitrificans]
MLCGEIDRHQRSVQALQTEMATLQVRVSALDRTMALFSPSLNPAAAGAVHAHAGKYGSFGGLTAFVREQLHSAGKSGVDTLALMDRAALRFDIDLYPPGARKRFKDTITWSLRHLQRNRLVEVAQDSRGGHRPKVWRSVEETTLQDLAAQVEAPNARDTYAS